MAEPIQGFSGGQIGGFSDRRARLSAKPDATSLIYGPRDDNLNILKPLYTTGGLVWPYTPVLVDQANVLYDSYDPVHTNQPFAAFKAVGPKEIVCSGTFTAQNQDEARYCVAAIHFLRTITKMWFGTRGERGNKAVSLRGTPPPILMFNAYGTAIYHNVPVIVLNYTVELPQDVDYVRALLSDQARNLSERELRNRFLSPTGSTTNTSNIVEAPLNPGDRTAWVPTRFTVSVTMQVQNTPDRLRRNFNLDDFRTGGLIKRGGWV